MSSRRSMEKRFVIWCIRWYQKILSPDQGIFRFVFFGKFGCGMYPSCSNYMIMAIEKYGLSKGVWKGIRRIGRCHPYQKQRVDFP